MDVRLNPSLGAAYKSRTQAVRRITENWATENLFCLACPRDHLDTAKASTPVWDYSCSSCGTAYQLKSSASSFGQKVPNSAYGPKMEAITSGRAPHYAFLRYSAASWKVTDLFVVPGHFFGPSTVEQRNPLPATARRSGWIGSNILLGRLPPESRLSVVHAEVPRLPSEARQEWNRYKFLGLDKRAQGGWAAEVLSGIRALERESASNEFTLQEFYRTFSREFASRYPANRNIEAKIRQQMQVLRDGGVLIFLGAGKYRIST